MEQPDTIATEIEGECVLITSKPVTWPMKRLLEACGYVTVEVDLKEMDPQKAQI